jgi:hypothetical protein
MLKAWTQDSSPGQVTHLTRPAVGAKRVRDGAKPHEHSYPGPSARDHVPAKGHEWKSGPGTGKAAVEMVYSGIIPRPEGQPATPGVLVSSCPSAALSQ